MHSDIKNLNNRIKFLRKKLGLKQREIADSLGVSQGHWSDIEGGRKRPSDTLLIAFAYRYALPLDWIKYGGAYLEIAAEITSPYGLPPRLEDLIDKLKTIYYEGLLDEKIKVKGAIEAVFDEIKDRKEEQTKNIA